MTGLIEQPHCNPGVQSFTLKERTCMSRWTGASCRRFLCVAGPLSTHAHPTWHTCYSISEGKTDISCPGSSESPGRAEGNAGLAVD